MAVSWTVRSATTTNSFGYDWVEATQLHSVTRYFNWADFSSWDGVSSINVQGTTADGTITVNWTEGSDEVPINPEI